MLELVSWPPWHLTYENMSNEERERSLDRHDHTVCSAHDVDPLDLELKFDIVNKIARCR
jgi:hypothetical protein